MVPSPFHGIFSALSADGSLRDWNGNVAPQQSNPAPTPPPTQSAAPTRSNQVMGQVALDIFEFDSYYIIKAPIAGVKLSDLDIEINDNVVTVRGVRRQTDSIPGDQYYLRECFWGPFERSVTLPCSVDQRKIKATFNKESVLKIIIPKEERVKIIRTSE